MQLSISYNKGLGDLRSRVNRSPTVVYNAIFLTMKTFTTKVKNDVQTSLNTRGEPDGIPRKRTGHLQQSTYDQVDKTSSTKITGIVGDNADYSTFLEFGTSRMKMRPFLRPAVMQNQEFYKKLLLAVVKKL